MQEGVEPRRQFVVACREALELFEPAEDALDEVSRVVAVPVGLTLGRAAASRRDDGLGAGNLNRFDQRVAVVPLVGDDGAGWNTLDQRSPLRDVRFLPTGEDQTQRIAKSVDAGVDLGDQPAPRVADRLIAPVFLGAPAECWCARTMVEPMKSSSSSASPRSVSAMRSQIPYVSARAKRTYCIVKQLTFHCSHPNSRMRTHSGYCEQTLAILE